ncbi:toxin-activating lysine-acyltransferase [Iodobacter ciconiae]|nr:toxin-activating lysine-acyltransferase [Iodobacter ciconiae]
MSISTINAGIKSSSEKLKPYFQMYIGAMVELCSQDALRKDLDIKSFLHWIKPAVLHDQFLFLQNDGEVSPSAYITWAFVNEETLHRYSHGPRFVLHPSEWNEGTTILELTNAQSTLSDSL